MMTSSYEAFVAYLEGLMPYAPLFAKGLGYTVFCCIAAIMLGSAIGVLLFFINTRKNFVCRYVYLGYISIFRGTPFLVQLFLVFYGGPMFGLALSPVATGIVCLGLYASAYFAEIYRSGFKTISLGHVESAIDIGLSRLQILLYIQIPQLFGVVIPPLTNQTIILIKESAILSIISVPELRMAALNMAKETYNVTDAYLLVALLYWGLTFAVSKLGLWTEKKTTHYLRRA